MKLTDIKPKLIADGYDLRGYVGYVEGVLSGKIVAGKYIKLAAKRFKDWFDRDDMYFDVEDVDKRIKLCYKLRHSTAQFSGKHFRLLPWQQFLFAGTFGFKWKADNLRVTRNVFAFIARKNGKTATAAALVLCALLGDGENGNEADFCANTTKQASICFEMTKNFADSVDPKSKIFKRFRNEIRIPKMKSKIQVLSSETSGLDGLNAGIAVLDETHAYKDWSIINVMKSSQGARQQPLLIQLTTAGFLPTETAPCYSTWLTCKDMLDGLKKDDTTFALLYQLDEDDDWTDEKVWIKASPSLGETVQLQYMRNQINDAKNNNSLATGIKTKNLNIFCATAEQWLPRELIVKNMQSFDLEMFKDKSTSYAYGGLDCATVSDLSCFTVMIEYDDKFWFKSFFYQPNDTIEESPNSTLYKEFKRQGYLTATQGNVCDHERILSDIIKCDKIVPFTGIAYDPWGTLSLVVNADSEGLPMKPFSQKVGNFSMPVKEFERMLRMGKIVIDKNPVTLWCFENAELLTDHNDNVKPVKGSDKGKKIDATISMTEAFGLYLYDNKVSPNMEVIQFNN